MSVGAMERRGFLKGFFGGVTAAGILVQANPAEIEAFARPLEQHAPMMVMPPVHEQIPAEIGERLYNVDGICVAIVRQVNVSVDQIEVTTAMDSHAGYIPGVMRVDIRAVGIGPHTLPVSMRRQP